MKRRRNYRKANQKKIQIITTASQIVFNAMRLIVGAVFVFSGFVKAVDPLGTVYKIEDYLNAFGGAFSNFTFIAFPAAFLLILFEWQLGINLLLKLKIKGTAFWSLLLMLFMTPLTLYIAINNPVSDCGCFGDALVLTNWQTFFKNVVLLAFVITIFLARKEFSQLLLQHVQWGIMLLFVVAGFVFMMYNYNHLPILDFRPYKVGVNIPDNMIVPDGAPQAEYDYSFVYEKEGVRKSFSLDQLPDSSWTFVDQRTTLIAKGYEPPITGFMILNASYEDVTDEILSFHGKTWLIVMHDVNKASVRGIDNVNRLYLSTFNTPVRLFVLTGSSADDITAFRELHRLQMPFLKADPIKLKTMIRSNPGAILIDRGTIVDKKHWRDLP